MHTTLIPLLVSAFIIMLASLSGVIFTWKTLGDWLTPRLHYLIALAAGVFTVIIFGLMSEVIHEGLSFEALGAFLLGGVLLEVIITLLPKNSHHHHEPCTELHEHGKLDARRMMIADAVHNVHDGLTLVPAFLVSPVVGLGTATGILLHEIVQEISEFFILKEAGYSTRSALLWNFAVSATILIGLVLAATLVSIGTLTTTLVAFSAGGFSYVLLRDLIPSILIHARTQKKYLQFGISFCIGLILMLTISILVPHEHEPTEDLELPEGFGLAQEPVYSVNTHC